MTGEVVTAACRAGSRETAAISCCGEAGGDAPGLAIGSSRAAAMDPTRTTGRRTCSHYARAGKMVPGCGFEALASRGTR